MRLSDMFFIVAILSVLSGMGLGIYMGIAHDFTLRPVHVHGNLLGFVTMFLCGLYYRVEPDAVSRLAYAQFAVAVLGFGLTVGGIAGIVSGNRGFLPVAVAGSLLSFLAMLLLLLVVARRAFAASRVQTAATDRR